MKKYVNGILTDCTAEEITEFNNRVANAPSQFDMAMEDLRRKRNALLAKTDWTDLPNTPLSNEKKTEWQTYRQQLRDLTNGIITAEQAKAVIFPNEVQ